MRSEELHGWTWHYCVVCDVRYDFEFRNIYSVNFQSNTCPKCHTLANAYFVHEEVSNFGSIFIVGEEVI